MTETKKPEAVPVEQPPFMIIKRLSGRVSVYRRSATIPEWDELKKFKATDIGDTMGGIIFTSRADAESRLKGFGKKMPGKFEVVTFKEAYELLEAQANKKKSTK